MQVLARVDAAEAAGTVEPWTDEVPPEKLLDTEPEPGTVAVDESFPNLGGRELRLSNGMRVSYRRSDLQDDQILLAVRTHATHASASRQSSPGFQFLGSRTAALTLCTLRAREVAVPSTPPLRCVRDNRMPGAAHSIRSFALNV